MPNKCSAFGCRSNYAKGPQNTVIKFPTEAVERNRWIAAMPNPAGSLVDRKDIWICTKHFQRADFIKSKGGKRSINPPSIFTNIPKSSFRQNIDEPRGQKTRKTMSPPSTKQSATSDHLQIVSWDNFVSSVGVKFPMFIFKQCGEQQLAMLEVSNSGSKVIRSISFQGSDVGPPRLSHASKEGHGVPLFELKTTVPKTGLVTTWSQIKELMTTLQNYPIPDSSRVEKAAEQLRQLQDVEYSSRLQFILSQFEMLVSGVLNVPYNKTVLVLATQLLCTSPAAYRVLKEAEVLRLPCEKLVRSMMTASLDDSYVSTFFANLPPEQRLVNILFDEVKLKSALRYSSGHVVGQAENTEGLASSALVTEVVCHHGGPKLVVGVHLVKKLSACQLMEILLNTVSFIIKSGGQPVALVCDNCPLNQSAYKKLGGPGKTYLETLGVEVHLIYDYVHIYKNLRNNWITEKTQELMFTFEDVQLTARWKDVQQLHKMETESLLKASKLTYSSAYPKTLQRQSVPLVSQVFNDKTVAAMKAQKDVLECEEGTIIFVGLVTEWFKMMNVKDKYSCVKLRDEARAPWTIDCPSFHRLNSISEAIASCRWNGPLGRREKKLTTFTADAFLLTTRCVIEIAQNLFTLHQFSYVLPAVFSQDPLEKHFGNTRQSNGGNFYIDSIDVTAAIKAQRTRQLLKLSVVPSPRDSLTSIHNCDECTRPCEAEDVELFSNLTIEDTCSLLESTEHLKHKVVFVAGYLARKHRKEEMLCFAGLEDYDPDSREFPIEITGDGCSREQPEEDHIHASEELVSSSFLDELNRGGLCLPTLSTVFFVHSAVHLVDRLQGRRLDCHQYISSLLSFIDAPLARCHKACQRLANILQKARVQATSDREHSFGCLRRQEKLQGPH